MQFSSVGRLHSQDAEPSSRQSSPAADAGHSHPSSCKTAPADGSDLEGSPIDETATPLELSRSESLAIPTHKKSRSRSSSAPHLAWLRSASRDRSGTANSNKGTCSSKSLSPSSSVKRLSGKFASKSRPTSSGNSESLFICQGLAG